MLQLWLAGFCTDAHTCGRVDARTLAHFHKGKNFLYVLDTLPSFFPPFSRFPHLLLLCHAKSCRCTGSSSVSSAGAGCRMRIQVAMRGKKKSWTSSRDAQVLREELQQRRQCTLKLPKPQQCVTTCCDIQCIFFLSLPVSLLLSPLKGSFFLNTFFLQESIARHYLCDCHKDFVSFEKQQLCQTISSPSSTYCGRLHVCRAHSSMLQWKLLSSSYLICMCI